MPTVTAPTPDPAFLRDLRDLSYWRQPDGTWRHNTRELTDTEAVQLGVWADCRPGGTAHPSEDAWALLTAADAPTTEPAQEAAR